MITKGKAEMVTPKIGLSRLAEMVPASFSSFYLTLISMIHGVALGLLATKLPNFISPFKPVGLLYASFTFAVIVIVWHEYVLAAQEFWWEITWWDSLVPFLLGMGEFLMIEYLGRGPNYIAWFFAASFTGLAGTFAYINYDRWLEESDFEAPAAFTLFKNEVRKGRWIFFAFALLNSASGVLLLFWSGNLQVVSLGLIFAGSLFCMIYKRLAWRIKALAIYGWQR
jgi:hypothetical protein